MVKYPVGGPREPVYALLRGLGFSMSPGLGDKKWQSADGIEVHIFGTGSMARVVHAGLHEEIPLDNLADRVAVLRFNRR